MCDEPTQQENALISTQNHGTILLMIVWSLACLLVIATVARIIVRFRSKRFRRLPWTNDIIIFITAFFALGSIVVISTAIASGLGKVGCLLNDDDKEQIQLKLFVTTILFILVASISKASVLLYLHHLVETAMQRITVIVISTLVVLWTIVVLAGMAFQCESPAPWRIWTGKCIPLIPFWMTMNIADVALEAAIVVFATYSIWRLRESYRQKTFATLLLSLRLTLIAASVVRLVYLIPAYDRGADPTFDSIPYIIATQGHVAFAVLIICSLCLEPYTRLHVSHSHALENRSRHWSDTTVGGAAYESYDSFAGNLPIVREPLPCIQAGMSNPKMPSEPIDSPKTDILLPDKPTPRRPSKPPPRPPPPRESQRPDMSLFIRTTIGR